MYDLLQLMGGIILGGRIHTADYKDDQNKIS